MQRDPAVPPSRLATPCVQLAHAAELAIPAWGGEPKGLEVEVAGAGGGHVRGRPADVSRCRPARGCSPSKTKDDGELPPAAAERSYCSAARTLELFSPDRGGAGSDAGPNPLVTKMRPGRSLGT
jgi:hypothetical protein